jgi:16S rRNA (cytosine967-C5)-methyltransferase
LRIHRNLAAAVVDNLREILDAGRYADKVIERRLKENPRWGGRDRRFIAEATYDIVRWQRLFQELTQSPAGDYWALLGACCIRNDLELPPWDEFRSVSPEQIAANQARCAAVRRIRESVPDWLDEQGERELGPVWDTELKALNEQARVVLRTNTLKLTRDALQARLQDDAGIETETLAGCPDALVLGQRQNIFGLRAFNEGLFEVQDAGSQRIAPYLDAEPGMRVIDACAGAGGKTLHLAALLQNKGRILALDTEEWKLKELKKRARRAGANDLIETRLIDSNKVIKRLAASADRLLLDVPCSGLGVLRRNPDAKWKLSPEFLLRVREQQQEILRGYAAMLKPGGILVYSTCSILPSENRSQIDHFLAEHGDAFEFLADDVLLPSAGFDGFYLCRLRKKAGAVSSS